MQYDLSILFYLKRGKKDKAGRSPIYCRITVNGGRAELSTNEKVSPDKWDSALQKLKGRSEPVRTINYHLDTIKSKIKKQFNSLIENEEEISAVIIKDFITGKNHKQHYLLQVFAVNNELVKKEEGSKYSKSTIDQYFTTLKRLDYFLKTEYKLVDIELGRLDVAFIRRFEIFLKGEYNIDHNTVMKHLKQLKKVIHFAMELGYIGNASHIDHPRPI